MSWHRGGFVAVQGRRASRAQSAGRRSCGPTWASTCGSCTATRWSRPPVRTAARSSSQSTTCATTSAPSTLSLESGSLRRRRKYIFVCSRYEILSSLLSPVLKYVPGVNCLKIGPVFLLLQGGTSVPTVRRACYVATFKSISGTDSTYFRNPVLRSQNYLFSAPAPIFPLFWLRL